MKTRNLRMKRAMRAALLVLLLNAVGMTNVFADGYDYAEVCPSGQTLYYRIDPDDSNAVIVVPPYYYHFDGQSAPIYEFWGQGYEKPVGDVVIPETLSNGLVVKKIGYYFNTYGPRFSGAFQNCTEITSVTMGNSVIEIGGLDWYGGAFSGCNNLTSVVFGNAVTIVGAQSFGGCTSLTSITLPNSLTRIDQKAFEGCTGLTSVTLPNSLVTIGKSAFKGCSNLASITIPNSIESIGSGAFVNTEWYNSQSDGILYLDNYCIGWKGEMPSIGELVIRDGTRGIADDAFGLGAKKNRNFTSVAFPQSLAFIGKIAFYGCAGLTSVNLPNSLVAIGESAFEECIGLTSVNLSNSLVVIGEDAFKGCIGLTSVTIPKSVTEIGGRAFYKCSRLSMVYYNAENATASNGAFMNCESLATLNIGPDVRNIDENVFKDCNTVHLVVALGANPAALAPGAFSGIAENSMLMVPCGKKMTYFSQWNTFPYDNIIENCDQFSISMGNIGAGGSVTSFTVNAQMGEEVQLIVTPNVGMAMESITISNANDPTQTIPYYIIGKANNKIGFIMPQFAVSVSATFKTSGASIGENDGVCVSVYPNPTSGQVTIKAEDLKQITVSNMLGQIVYEGKANGNEFTYDFGNHEAGVYVVRIETANGVAVRKVSVTR